MHPPAGRMIDLADAPLCSRIQQDPSTALSDNAFANLFLFRNVHGYRIHHEILPHVRGLAYDGTPLVIPLFNPSEASRTQIFEILGDHAWLYPFSQNQTDRLGARFVASWNDADSDYVYTAERLRSFRGLKKRRQQLNDFTTAHAAGTVFRPLEDADAITAARQILDTWQADVNLPASDTDFSACVEALDHRIALGLFGLLVEVAAQPAGFILASRLSSNMAAIHFAKGLRRFAGIYPFMFQTFARIHCEFDLINFEQDLGRPGFRQAKQSYRPVYRARKYRLRPAHKPAA